MCALLRAGRFSAAGQTPLYDRLESELKSAGDSRDVVTYLSELKESLRDLIREDYLRGTINHGGHHSLECGQLSETTGYLHISAMAGQSETEGDPEKDIEVADTLMQKALKALGDLPNLVVDIRGNGGGYDGVALHFASYLTGQRHLAFTKSARQGEGFTPRQSIQLTPADTRTYQGNLFVLTSKLTASAAEIFVLALLQRPHLTLIGEPTQGILSDTLERHLPNGWLVTLSNEMYRAFDEQCYEDVGIPPHIHMPFLAREGRENGRDLMLDRVLALTRGGGTN